MIYVKKEKEGIVIELRNHLLKEQERLANIIEKAKKELSNAPEGTLRISINQGCTQFYHNTEKTTHNGIYLSKKNIELARQLAQKSYSKKVLKYAEKTYMQITRLLEKYQDEKLEQIYYSEHKEKQKLIVPMEETYEQKLEKWIAQSYVGKGFKDDAPVIMTNNGLRVRSKSEKIMADYFDTMGIVYKYECPLKLSSYGVVFPDFTFLSRKTGQEIYWEHEGMLDNPEYARTAVKKIESYEKNGIYPGENLLLTFESSNSVLNADILKTLVQRYLL